MSTIFIKNKRGVTKKIFSTFLLFIFVVVNFFGFNINTAHAASWYDTSWTYRTTITIDHTKVGLTTEDESNFPVLVSLTGLSNIKANGADIRFTSSDGTTELPREIESYSSGTLVAHVKIPTLSHTSDTVIYMYYGNSSATEPAANSTYGSQNVWDTNYKGVWHMNDTTTSTVSDSTGLNANGSKRQANNPNEVSALIGKGQDFISSTDYISVAENTSNDITSNAITFGGWIYPDISNTYQLIMGKLTPDASSRQYALYLTGGNTSSLYWRLLGVGGNIPFTITSPWATGTWNQIYLVYNGSTVKLYLNGSQVYTGNFAGNITHLASSVYFGKEATNYYGLDGREDEMRLSSTARSAGWISTEYKNQNSPSTFYSVTAPVAPDAPTALTPTSGNTQVSLSWTAPANNGGSVITDYVIDYKLSSDSTWSTFADGVSTNTTGTVTGLTNGSSYDFRVSAVNAIGQGSASGTATAIPATVPGAPTIGTATAGNTQASVTFTPPSNGGSAITSYTVTSSPGSFTGTGGSSPIIVTGLTNGTAYTFTVTATNAVGTGSASAVSNSVTPATVPGAPTAVSPSVGNAQISLSWSAPASNGGSAITDYVIEYKLTSEPTVWSTFSDGVSTNTTGTVTGLTNGLSYDFRISAVNSAGQGSASSPAVSSTPITTPGAPTSATATRGNTEAIITFSAPSSNGGSTITSYTITSNPDSHIGTGSASPITVTGLTNGTAYTFTVTATNAAGTGSASSASNSVTPATTPDAPTSPSATAGNAQATVSFTAPVSNGGSAITGYTVTSSPGGITGTGASSPIIVTGLNNGTAYTFTVTATNDVGVGTASVASNSVTPVTVPGAPTIGTATAGNTQVSVTFTPPASDGGSVITSYTVTSSPGNFTGTGGTSPIIVAGLTNGTAYTFTVTATNVVGTGPASSASNSATPVTVPDSPTALTPTAGNTQVGLSWIAPANNGGGTITDYVIEYKLSSDSSWSTFADGVSTNTTGTVTGLTNGLSYDFRVSAANSAGLGSASASVNAIPVTVPGAPTIGTATAGNAQASITFSAPASDGGSAITGYTVTSSPGGFTGTGSASPIIVTGLTNGTAYTFTVTATNAVGTGSASSASNSVTPVTVPGVPTAVSAVGGNTQATISFTAPASDGGSAITGYTVTSSPGGFTGTGSVSPIVVTGLTNGNAYTFTVTATNAVGTGSASSPSNSVTLSTEPGVPVNLAATVEGSSIGLSWSAPTSDGGSAITDYIVEYQLTTGGTWSVFADGTSVNTTALVTGLSNNTSYDFRVRAVNIIGQSLPSNSVSATPGEPAQVFIQSFPDLTNPSIGTAIRITNEGLVAYEYQYTWCITDAIGNLCGGGNDIFSASAAKLIQPSENWDTTLNSTVPTPGDYYFHISVTYGSEVSSAYQSFTAVATFPDPPTSASATAGNTQATVSFTAPVSNGGSVITGYTVTSNPGGLTGTGSASPITVTGLTNGTAYTFTVTATNAVGTGQSSSPPTNSVTPATVPGAINSFSASAGNTEVGLSWSAPASDGGSAITDYVIEYKLSSDSNWVVFADSVSTATSVTVTGLTNNLSYDFRVSAVNAIGQGPVNSTSTTSITPPPTNTGGGSSGGGHYIYPPATVLPITPPTTPNIEIVPPTTPNTVPSTKVPKTISPITPGAKPNKNEVSATPTETSHITPPEKQKQTPVENSGTIKKTSGVPWIWIIVSSILVFLTGFIFFILRRRRMDNQKN
jgi:hypothetical protein